MANPAAAPLAAWPAQRALAVAYSGGADSTALLHAAVSRWPDEVRALHVHHGLQPAADQFSAHCEAECKKMGIPITVIRVDARHAAGESPEDAARRSRYRALAQAAVQCGRLQVLLGQHADDQVETLLLALSRGAGLPGLAGMPTRFERHGMVFGRPLLEVSAKSIRSWLVAAGVPYLDDPTNANTAFTRNRIRHALLPVLEEAFPRYRETFMRSSRHAAQAQGLLDALAEIDIAATAVPPVLASIQKLARDRQANLLRYWLRTSHDCSPSAAQLEELLSQVAACVTRGHSIRIKIGAGTVVRDGDRLAFKA